MMTSERAYPSPQRGASLMLAFRPTLTLITGSNRLAATRAFSALEAESKVVVLAKGGLTGACDELKWRMENGELDILDFGDISGSSSETSQMDTQEAIALERFLDGQPPGSLSIAFITDTLISSGPSIRRSRSSARQLYDICRRRNVPVNVTDLPELCDFTVCSSYRFQCPNGNSGRSGVTKSDVGNEGAAYTSLQVGVTTNGQGCRLASRIRREIVAKLPSEVGIAVEKVGRLRKLAKDESRGASLDTVVDGVEDAENELNEEITVASPNRPVKQRTKGIIEDEPETERSRRRMKWVAQISEYWSFAQLAALTEEEMTDLLAGEQLSSRLLDPLTNTTTETPTHIPSHHDLTLSPPVQKPGSVLLVGSGPGHPSLLTLAAHDALTRLADLILADKLVPSGVLALIPSHIELRIARKFPGNADGAQQELMDMALTAARAGKTVVRLKQGDPALYGRVGEEVLFLRKHGVGVLVVPGISSALAAPLFGGIPVTQRGAADSLAVATGVGRGGAKGRLPGYERGRTLVLLMGNARLESLVTTLLSGDGETFEAYPPNVPAAIIERASMPDQRVITAPLSSIYSALESAGEQRPPGLLVVGWTVLSLWGRGGDTTVLDEFENDEAREVEDRQRVERWLEGRKWHVSEGIDAFWDTFRIPALEQ